MVIVVDFFRLLDMAVHFVELDKWMNKQRKETEDDQQGEEDVKKEEPTVSAAITMDAHCASNNGNTNI